MADIATKNPLHRGNVPHRSEDFVTTEPTDAELPAGAGGLDLVSLLSLSGSGTSMSQLRHEGAAASERAGFTDVALIHIDEDDTWHLIGDDSHVEDIGVSRPGDVTRRAFETLATQWAADRVAAPLMVEGRCWGILSATRRSANAGDATIETIAAAIGSVLRADALRNQLMAAEVPDTHTGLPLKTQFLGQLGREMARATRTATDLSVVLLDIDRHQMVHEPCGLAVVERVRAQVARALATVVRNDEMIARVDADAFGWILAGVGPQGARIAAERAFVAVEVIDLLPGKPVTMSAGVADLVYASDPTTMVGQAREALYWAKLTGRGIVAHYSPSGPTVIELRETPAGHSPSEQSPAGGPVQALLHALENADPAAARHGERVGMLVGQIAQRMDWSDTMVAAIRDAGYLHDIGMLALPDAIVNKPGKLTKEEFEQVKTHAALGAEMASKVIMPAQAAWIRGHHERFEGSGYPDGLAGDDIPEGARILALADAWDTMTHARSYAPTLSEAEALGEVHSESGTQFCPKAVEALHALMADRATALPAPRESHEKVVEGRPQE